MHENLARKAPRALWRSGAPRAQPARRRLQPCMAAHEQHSTAASTRLGLAALTALSAAAAAPAWAGELAVDVTKRDNGFLNPIVDSLDFVLGNIESFYQTIGLPYAYGWSIVSLTAFAKLLTFPLTKKQVESAMAVQQLKPRIDIIKKRYGEDKNKVNQETSRLYKQAEVNPAAGCGPSLLQLPIFIGLYRSLNNVATSGTLDNEGFFWIPSLAGPMSTTARTDGSATAWLLPFTDGAPPIGWEQAWPYLVLPVLLLAAQYASSAIISPIDPNDENANTTRIFVYLLPLTIGWFSLTVPSGLSLYYFSNTVLTSALQIYFRKLGGVVLDTPDLGPVKQLGMGRRSGPVVKPPAAAAALPAMDGPASLASEFGADVAAPSSPAAANGAEPVAAAAASTGAAPAAGAAAEAQSGAGAFAKGESEGIVGGLVVDQTQMEGVAEAELEFLRRRCKRRRQPVPQ